jgi:hypothetical protein
MGKKNKKRRRKNQQDHHHQGLKNEEVEGGTIG